MAPEIVSEGVAASRASRRVAPFIALAVAVVLGLLFWVLAGSSPGSTERADSQLLGKPAPAVVSSTIDGAPFDLSRRKGSWVVINFFDSTCVPCRAEHPELIKFAEQQRALGVDGAELYTVINRDSQSAVRTWFAANGGDWPIVTDDDGHIGVVFGIAKVPETWVIDPDGVVVVRFAGSVTAEGLSNQIQQLRQRAKVQ